MPQDIVNPNSKLESFLSWNEGNEEGLEFDPTKKRWIKRRASNSLQPIVKAGFKHKHDNWQEHPIGVKYHQQYFAAQNQSSSGGGKQPSQKPQKPLSQIQQQRQQMQQQRNQQQQQRLQQQATRLQQQGQRLQQQAQKLQAAAQKKQGGGQQQAQLPPIPNPKFDEKDNVALHNLLLNIPKDFSLKFSDGSSLTKHKELNGNDTWLHIDKNGTYDFTLFNDDAAKKIMSNYGDVVGNMLNQTPVNTSIKLNSPSKIGGVMKIDVTRTGRDEWKGVSGSSYTTNQVKNWLSRQAKPEDFLKSFTSSITSSAPHKMPTKFERFKNQFGF